MKRLALFVLVISCLLVSGCYRHNEQSHPVSVIAPASVNYEDGTNAAGIRFLHDDCRNGMSTMMEQAGPGCAIFDFDGDGWPDLYLLNGRDLYGRGMVRENALYHNNRDGTFSDITRSAGVPGTGYGMGAAVGDYDNDGHPDIYVCQYGKNVLYHNNGDGTFSDVTARARVDGMDYGESFHTGAAWIDYDRDGKLDLFVCGYVKFSSGPRYCEIGANGSNIKTNCPPSSYQGSYCILYHNNGDGTFTNVTRKAGVWLPGSKSLTAMVVDFNDDGWPDLYVGNDGIPAFLLKNNGNGTFKEIAAESGIAQTQDGKSMAAMGIDFGDYKNNGKLSLFVADFQNIPDHLFENVGHGQFVEVTDRSGVGDPTRDFLGFGGGFLDYDNDGWLDIFVANGHVYPEIDHTGSGMHYRQHAQLLHNRTDGTFEEVTDQAGAGFKVKTAGRGAAWGDLWNRGVVDILEASNSGPPLLLKNSGTPGRHFISLRLVGTRSNRDAIGARVTVSAGTIHQMQEVRSSASYLSSCDTRLHFGLGNHTKLDKIEIRWPSGRHDAFIDQPVDRFYQLVEGRAHLDNQVIAPKK